MSDGLLASTPAEDAYFESGGEKAPEQEPATGQQQQADSPEGGKREQAEGQKPEGSQAQPDRPKPGFVPHAALHEERRKRQQLEAELAEFRKFKEQIEAEKAKPQIPDLATDPVGHFKMATDLTQQELAAIKERQARADQESQRQQAEQRFQMTVIDHERRFVKDTPDYFDAMQHLREVRDQELQMYGVVDPTERQSILHREAMGIAWNAMQTGQNPAQKAYELARFRGYKPGPKAAEKIDTLKKGAEAAKSLSGKGGEGPAAMSPEALLEMSDEDFDKHFEKVMRGKK